ncbi:NAD(P)H-binding protein [Fructilactobacillus cliffordii]|uniref:NAD(P)H-binding protein n=1 Tax=Fructilactobacillus cliffordii TaxID=2940299 RepID=A0A9Q8ZT56_9LACO|nr:NAD(P)H-binding protein [Fructilactobacillus cliffordii]USS88832.1 NAD(P)H-binding protein [Fructilactobacillus cliffordii]
MRVTILAAAGQIAELVTKNLMTETDDQLTLVAREADSRLTITDAERENLVDLDVNDVNGLAATLRGEDLVLLATSPDERMANSVIKAMDQAGVSRLIVTGAIGVENEVPGKFGEWNRRMGGDLLAAVVDGFHTIENSDLDYTYLRMTWLYNDPRKTDYVITEPGKSQPGVQVTRTAVANFLTELIKSGAQEYQRASIGIYEPGSDQYDKPTFY